ncbi:3330_t:CDS:1 [Acaulospora morrowiae]|uniref:3330_t:CDS:1 n=1 Tax=Acaulospora morrowiae TaxID=94023 RepID=A0A9N9B474_9GLOM|nr:3330_t:CDS:1 [Acaulospora morrowiae]
MTSRWYVSLPHICLLRFDIGGMITEFPAEETVANGRSLQPFFTLQSHNYIVINMFSLFPRDVPFEFRLQGEPSAHRIFLEMITRKLMPLVVSLVTPLLSF